ncbi:partial glycerol-3-phosphate dehydrogenase (NAD(P)+), partial [Burkholderiaceae bacterium]
MNLTVLGAGAWGTALAINASTRHAVRLWARDDDQVQRMRIQRCNQRYLADVALPDALQISADFDTSVEHARGGLVVIATPMSGLGEMLKRLPPDAPGVFWLCKGFQEGTGWLGHEVARAVCPQARVGVLSGPSFAIEVARGQPTALVAASADAALCDEAVAALHSDNLRIYTSADPVGVEVGGAVKNVLSIATGIADGMRLGLN